jgi:hypothetical protein
MSIQNQLEDQGEDLLKELLEIVTKKWNSLNRNGSELVENILNDLNDIFIDQNPSNSVSNQERIELLTKTNSNFNSLNQLLTNFLSILQRIGRICSNLSKTTNYSTNDFSESFGIINLNDFLNDITLCYEKEYSLKYKLINENLIYKSRFNRNFQVYCMACWIQQPFIDDLLIEKLQSMINFKFYNLKNEQKLIKNSIKLK